MVEKTLARAERIIEKVARKFNIDGLEFEDLAQIGRIKTWQIIEKKQINNANFGEFVGLIRTVVERALMDELKRSRAKKRIQLGKLTPLDKPLKEGGGNLYEVLHDQSGEPAPLRREIIEKGARSAVKTRSREAAKATIQLVIEYLDITRREIPQKINYQTFVDLGLQNFLWIFFNNSPFRAINFAYPGEFLPYQMRRSPMRYWKSKHGKRRAARALRDAVQKTNYSPASFPKLITEKFLKEAGLDAAWRICFNYDRFAFLSAAFPEMVFHPWEFSFTPKGYFDSMENVIKATKWLVEEIYGIDMPNLSPYEVWKQRVALVITKESFDRNGLRAVRLRFSTRKLLELAYPEKFLPWSFQNKGKWAGEAGQKLAAEATRWLVEEYCKVSPLSPEVVREDFFKNNGFWGMLTDKRLGFNSSPRAALRNAYPEINF